MRRRTLLSAALCGTFLLAACVEESLPEAEILAIGDSVIWWNSGSEAAIADVIADDLGVRVANAAIPGARVLAGSENIPGQYQSGPWEWVVLDGGANDLGGSCGTARADAVLDLLITQDLTNGAMPRLLARVRGDGPQVVIMGYYFLPEETQDFAGCTGVFTALNSRLEAYADQTAGVYFTPASAVIDPDNPAHFDRDGVHPSPLGSRLIGRQIATQIRSAPDQ